ncbi:MAG: hypothetical protein M3014_10875 [Chloroflexota bacterium]|nr:hypothetical protein [Chloroflexota bacterium]
MSSTIAAVAPAYTDHVEQTEQEVITPRERGLRLRHLWAIVPLAIAWFTASIDFIEPFDFWWNVKSGQIMAQTGRFLGDDVLVWTPVRLPYSNPQWGSQLLFYWLYSASPYILLTARVLIVVATLGIVLWLCTWKSRSLKVASIATVVAYLTTWTNFGVRPQMFAILPFVVYLFLLERKDAHPRWLPLLVPIMLFWVNVHGSFFLGVALIGIYALGTVIEKVGSGEGRRWLRSRAAGRQAFWLLLAVAATLANPYFIGIYNYFFIATNDPVARSLNAEWQSPTLYDGTGILFFTNLLIFVAALYFGKRRMRPTELLLIVAFGYLSLVSLRNVMWWDWVTAPILAANLVSVGQMRFGPRSRSNKTQDESSKAQTGRTELPAANWLIAILLIGGAFLYTPLWRQSNPLVAVPARVALADNTPKKVGEFLRTGNVPGPIFNYMEWGGYLEWALYPGYKMFIDGRFEARQVQVWRDYISISRGRADWQQTLDRYGVRTLVLNKAFHADLIPFVGQTTSWRKVYEDKSAVVYVK